MAPIIRFPCLIPLCSVEAQLKKSGQNSNFLVDTLPYNGFLSIFKKDFIELLDSICENENEKRKNIVNFYIRGNDDPNNLNIPDNVTHVHFSCYFNKDISNIDFKNATHIIFDQSFIPNISNVDWKNVTNITFGVGFNQDISNVDWKNVTNIYFSFYFNQDISNVDWKNVQYITFGSRFNQDISNVDWKNVQYITFGSKFNQDISNVNWGNVTNIVFGFNFNRDISNVDWKNVVDITFNWGFNQDILNIKCNNNINITFINDKQTFIDGFTPFNQLMSTPIKGINTIKLCFTEYTIKLNVSNPQKSARK